MTWAQSLCRALAWSCLALALAAPARAGHPKMSEDLAEQAEKYANSRAMKNLIVRLRRGVDPDRLARRVGGRLKARLDAVDGAALELPYGLLKKLADLPEVEWVSPDRRLSAVWDCDVETAGADPVRTTRRRRCSWGRVCAFTGRSPGPCSGWARSSCGG